MAIPTMLQAPTRNLFDFWNAAIPNAKTQQVPLPTTNTKQSVNEQIMSRLLPQGTINQQIRNVIAPANIGKTQQQVNVSKPMYSNDTKLAIWKQHGGDESNFDTNDFNHTNTGAIYLKNEALAKIKPKETPSVLPTAKAQETKAQPMHLFSDEKEAYDKMLADGISEDEANQTIKERRVQLLPDNGLTANEKSALLKMQADGMTAKDATETLSLYRQKHQEAIEQAKAEAQNAWYWEKAVNALTGLLLGVHQWAGNLLDTFTNLAASTYGGTGTDIGKQFEEAGKKYGQTMPWLEYGMQAGNILYGMGADVATGWPKNAILTGAKSWAIQEATNKSWASLEDLATGAAVGWAIGWAVGLAWKGIKIIKPKVSKLAETVSTKANRFNALDEQKFIDKVGETPGQFAVSRGMNEVGEKAVDKATQNYKASLQQADKAFEQIKPVVKYDWKWYDPVQVSLQDLRKRLTNTKDSGLDRVNELIKKYDNSWLSMTEINEVKRLYSKNFKYWWEDRNSEALARSSNIQNALREWQFKKAQDFWLKNIAEINKNTQAWKMYADSLEKKINRSSANNLVSLTDLVALSGGQPMNLALFLGKKIGASEKAKTAIIKTLGKQTKTPISEPQIETQPIAGLLPSRATPKTINLWPSQKEIIAESKKPLKIKK